MLFEETGDGSVSPPEAVSAMAIAQTFMQLLHNNLAFNPPVELRHFEYSVIITAAIHESYSVIGV